MRTLLSTRCGGPETLELKHLARPVPGPGQILIRVASCGINYPDVLIIEDRYQHRPPRPFAPGGEVSGVIAAIGEGVAGFAPGDRVAALTYIGGLADHVACDAAMAMKLPDDLPGPEAAMLMSTYATSYHALVDRGRISPGDRVVILGAAGGVGLAAVEIAAALGATVLALVSSPEKADAVRAAGAAHVIVHDGEPRDAASAKAMTGLIREALGDDGADIVYDPVGGGFAEPAVRAMAWNGRYLVVGFVAGIPSVPFNLPLLKGCEIVGVFMGGFAARDPDGYAANLRALFDLYSAGRLRPHISARYPLARGGDAIAVLRDRQAIGKIVVDMDEVA
ncbi:NADPH:quinone oxidoreductase family protein [Sphingomonas colocasiae]|uniref:NADPH:quinone oxidoreductase family protein n=2 Tax=Sphingomonas colocasiae TaxID=1848973 RepID=A0ABS7PWQ3_9SPHN|nr:NADPH:quinone oxidoreductase family protein [Sphingomonas colocasiae]MBY8824414.1 NADPH:quinone oxidoreductase family protein [Sphingomonas colocasiae]